MTLKSPVMFLDYVTLLTYVYVGYISNCIFLLFRESKTRFNIIKEVVNSEKDKKYG